MRQTISGLVAAFAVMTASAVPAMACGGGLFQSSCSPCGQTYVDPCARSYVAAPIYTGCNTGCGGWGYERLPDPALQYGYTNRVHQYYYVNQGPTYSGPGNFAPYPSYQENGWDTPRRRSSYYGYTGTTSRYYDGDEGYRYRARPHFRARYMTRYTTPRTYGYRERTLRRYY